MQRSKFLDRGSFIVASVTLTLFIAALFAKGVTHDLFLEAGVFLVSVKIILTTYRNTVVANEINQKLDQVLAALNAQRNANSDPVDPTSTGRNNRN